MRAEQQLESFLARYTPEISALAREARAKLQARIAGAQELVYENYNALVIGFGPSDRASEAILSIVLYAKWVNLCFLQGAKLADPDKLLQGSGTTARNVRLSSAALLDSPALSALIQQALERAKVRINQAEPHRLIIKSISEKQRPRRPVSPSPQH